MSDVIKGVEWVILSHNTRVKGDPYARSVANMSLGGGASPTLDRAVNAAVDAGVHFAVAAGNDYKNACDYSPAAAEKAVTVGAVSIDDRMASFSNYGKCVDVFAPGKDITSTWIGSNVATNTISGTSMASPHVAGLMAYFLSQYPKQIITGQQLRDYIVQVSTKNIVQNIPVPRKGRKPIKDPRWPFPWPPGNQQTNPGVTPNRLIFNGVGSATPLNTLPLSFNFGTVRPDLVRTAKTSGNLNEDVYTGESVVMNSVLQKAVDLIQAIRSGNFF
jgi:cerevisin